MGAGTEVTCRFKDGPVLHVPLSFAEAEDLASRGTPVGPASRIAGFVGRHASWLIGVLAAVLVGPAIGKQWSDRNQELSLKNDLVATVSSSVATSITRAEEIARQHGSPIDRRNAMDAWTRAQSSLTGSFSVYFPGGEVPRLWSNMVREKSNPSNWLGFRNAVGDFVELSCCVGRSRVQANRVQATLVGDIYDVLGRKHQGPTYKILSERDVSRDAFVRAFHRLGLTLFETRNSFLAELGQAHAAGFSRGWRDFLHNVAHPVG